MCLWVLASDAKSNIWSLLGAFQISVGLNHLKSALWKYRKNIYWICLILDQEDRAPCPVESRLCKRIWKETDRTPDRRQFGNEIKLIVRTSPKTMYKINKVNMKEWYIFLLAHTMTPANTVTLTNQLQIKKKISCL